MAKELCDLRLPLCKYEFKKKKKERLIHMPTASAMSRIVLKILIFAQLSSISMKSSTFGQKSHFVRN